MSDVGKALDAMRDMKRENTLKENIIAPPFTSQVITEHENASGIAVYTDMPWAKVFYKQCEDRFDFQLADDEGVAVFTRVPSVYQNGRLCVVGGHIIAFTYINKLCDIRVMHNDYVKNIIADAKTKGQTFVKYDLSHLQYTRVDFDKGVKYANGGFEIEPGLAELNALATRLGYKIDSTTRTLTPP